MSESSGVGEWLRWVLVSSFPLRKIDSTNNVVAFASATVIDYRQRRFLLTVEHAVSRGSTGWILPLQQTENGTDYYAPRAFSYLGDYSPGTLRVRDVDFCFAEVPTDLTGVYQHVTPRGIFDERPRHIFVTDLVEAPSARELYAFSGEVRPEQHTPDIFAVDRVVYPGLRYDRTEGDFHVFKLPVSHPGHEHFRGCSGAPIVDQEQRLVALLCSGDECDDSVRGLTLAKIKIGLDMYLCFNESRTTAG